MRYYMSATLEASFEHAIARTEAALKAEGFGVISRIDIKQTLKVKVNVDFRPYMILGACNPTLAYEALQLEDKVGTMLPCNVVVQEIASGQGISIKSDNPDYPRWQNIELNRIDIVGRVLWFGRTLS